MPTVTVDLPAQNVMIAYPGAGVPGTRIGGLSCLAAAGDGEGVRISGLNAGFYVGATPHPVLPEYGGSSGTTMGFGLFDLPADATLVDCRFVANMVVEGPTTPNPYPEDNLNFLSPYPATFPAVNLAYGGSHTEHTLTPPASPSEVTGTAITHLIGGADYVISGIGTPDTGTFGLCPFVTIYHPLGEPYRDTTVFIDYLAIRLTYTYTERLTPNLSGLAGDLKVAFNRPRPMSR